MTGNLIEREWRFEKLHQVLTLTLNQIFLHAQEPFGGDRSIVGKRCGKYSSRAHAAQACKAAGQHFDRDDERARHRIATHERHVVTLGQCIETLREIREPAFVGTRHRQ